MRHTCLVQALRKQPWSCHRVLFWSGRNMESFFRNFRLSFDPKYFCTTPVIINATHDYQTMSKFFSFILKPAWFIESRWRALGGLIHSLFWKAGEPFWEKLFLCKFAPARFFLVAARVVVVAVARVIAVIAATCSFSGSHHRWVWLWRQDVSGGQY